MTSSYAGLPDVLREIAEVAGLEAAVALAETYGGVQRRFPRHAGPHHWLTRCVGAEAAAAICTHFAVSDADGRAVAMPRLMIPKGGTSVIAQAKRHLARELRNGTGVRTAALRAGLGERAAWRLKAKLRRSKDDGQGHLF